MIRSSIRFALRALRSRDELSPSTARRCVFHRRWCEGARKNKLQTLLDICKKTHFSIYLQLVRVLLDTRGARSYRPGVFTRTMIV